MCDIKKGHITQKRFHCQLNKLGAEFARENERTFFLRFFLSLLPEGLPSVLPLAFTLASPALVRSDRL